MFEVKRIHLQAGVKVDEGFVAAIAKAIQACAEWHGTTAVRVLRSDPPSFAAALRRALRSS